MLNPFSWTLDNWFSALQVASAIILGLTVAIGYLLNQRQTRDLSAANRATEELRQQNLETEKRLEAERSAREELQLAVAPRSAGEQSSFAQKLATVPGVQVIIETISEPEARQLAGELAVVAQIAGWNILRHADMPDEWFDDVTVAFNPRGLSQDVDRLQIAL